MAMETSRDSLQFIADKVSFATSLPMLGRATSEDDKPTPGYLYEQICELTMQKGSYCNQVLDYLLDRLTHSSCHVKFKSLKILHFVVDNGHSDFRESLKRRSSGIKEATMHGGPPDPVHGNTPYVMVRREANELCNVLFMERASGSKHDSASGMAPVAMSGMGSTSQRKGTMQGFGNVVPQENSIVSDMIGGIKKLASAVSTSGESSKSTPAALEADKYFTDFQPVEPPAETPVNDNSREMNPPLMSRDKRVQYIHKPGRAGGGWEDDDDDEDTVTSTNRRLSNPQSSSSRHSARTSASSNDGRLSNGAAQVDDQSQCTAEERLVRESLAKSPDRALLSRKEVNVFINGCAKVSCTKCLEILCARLGDEGSIGGCGSVLKGLQLLEGLIGTDLVSPEDLTALCLPILTRVVTAQTGPTQSKARKLSLIIEKLMSCLVKNNAQDTQ